MSSIFRCSSTELIIELPLPAIGLEFPGKCYGILEIALLGSLLRYPKELILFRSIVTMYVCVRYSFTIYAQREAECRD